MLLGSFALCSGLVLQATSHVTTRRASSPKCLFEEESKVLTVQKPLGIRFVQVEDYEASGAIVAGVEPGSNAERAGVIAGDILMALGELDLSMAYLDDVNKAIEDEPNERLRLRFRPIVTGDAFGWGANAMQ